MIRLPGGLLMQVATKGSVAGKEGRAGIGEAGS